MRFAAKTSDAGHIESLTRVVAMVGKLAKQCALRIGRDRLSFSRPGSLRTDDCHKVYCEITSSSYFDDFRMEGWSAAENEIVLEVMLDELHQCLRSASHATMMKMKLTKKGNAPYLTIEVKLPSSSAAVRTVTHDVPVNVVPPRLWAEFAEPELPTFNVSFYLPSVKTVQKIVTAMKSMTNYLKISANTQGGDMTFHIRTDPAEVTTFFKDLVYAEWSDETSQGSDRRSQLSGRRIAERFDAARGDVSNRSNAEDKVYYARVEIKTLSQFLSSQQSAHYRLVVSIVDRRLLHICAVSDDLRFQYFMPSIDE